MSEPIKNGNLRVPIAIAVVLIGITVGLIRFIFVSFQEQTLAAIMEVKDINERQDEQDRRAQEQISTIEKSVEGIRGDVKALTAIVESQNSYFKRAFGLK